LCCFDCSFVISEFLRIEKDVKGISVHIAH